MEQFLERSASARWRDVRGLLGHLNDVEQVVLDASSACEDDACLAFHETFDESGVRCVVNNVVRNGV